MEELALFLMNFSDKTYQQSAIEQSIALLTSEIVRLTRLPYRSWRNLEKIRNLDDQILYLEETLSAYERDLKKV